MALHGERLKDLREKRGLKQNELAGQVKISTRLLQKYEAGESDPSADNLAKLADALMTTTDYLTGRVTESAPYIQGDLSLLERLVIFLLRRNRLPPNIESAINDAINNSPSDVEMSQQHTTDNQNPLTRGKRSKPV